MMAGVVHDRPSASDIVARTSISDAGVTLDHRPLSARERREYARERRQFAQDLDKARYWKWAMIRICEQALIPLKAALFDPTSEADPRAVEAIERVLTRVRRAGDTALVGEYHLWVERLPLETAAMVDWARLHEQAERRDIERFLERRALERSLEAER